MSINPLDLAAAAEGILNHQSLQQRERLLAASALASRLLLGSPDVMKAMPEVLRVLDGLQSDELCPCNWEKGQPTLQV